MVLSSTLRKDSMPQNDQWPRNTDYRFEHLFLRHLGRGHEGYSMLKDNEERCGGAVKRISALSEALLSYVKLQPVIRQRRQNYLHLHRRLGRSQLPLEHLART